MRFRQKNIIICTSLFFLSIGITSFQIVLMQILAYLQWYHFAYLIVALALLGFGVSGTFFSLFRQYLLDRSERLLPILMLLCGVAMPLSVRFSTHDFFSFDLYLLFVEKSQFVKFISVCFFYCVPIFLGALAIGIVLAKGTDSAGTFYFANLLGSGIGGITGLLLVENIMPSRLPGLVGLFPAIGAFVFLVFHKYRWPYGLVVTAVFICSYLLFYPADLKPSQFKDISRTMHLPDARILARLPGSHGLVELVSAPALRYAPDLSLNYRGIVPKRNYLFVNGELYGTVVSEKSALQGKPFSNHKQNPKAAVSSGDNVDRLFSDKTSRQTSIMEYSTDVLGYLLANQNDALLLAPGGTGPVEHAIARKMANIIVVEPNNEILNILNMEGANRFSNYDQPKVRFVHSNPRSFLSHTDLFYDLIRFPRIGTFSGTIGLYALTEQFLLTKESFKEALNRLKPDGVIQISVWLDYPFKRSLKVLATLVEMLEENGFNNPKQHIAAVRNWGMVTFAVKKSQITAEDSVAIRNNCGKLGFDPLLLPGILREEREQYHHLNNDIFFSQVDSLLNREKREQFYSSYDFNVHPASDNKPYFSQFIRLFKLYHQIGHFNLYQIPFFEMGSFILAITLILLLLFAVILIVLPIGYLGYSYHGYSRPLIYFAALGTGYMLVEIVFIQKLTLFLGEPVRAVATVLTSLLIFSGLGSLMTERISSTKSSILLVTALGALIIFLYYFLLLNINQLRFLETEMEKILFAMLIIAPLGLLLGMPFPIGLRFIGNHNPLIIPLVWGVNGCFSVIGPALGTLIAVQWGFAAVFGFAGGAYLLAVISMSGGRIIKENISRI